MHDTDERFLSEFRQHITSSLMIREDSLLVLFSIDEVFGIYIYIYNFFAKNVIVKLNLLKTTNI